MVSEHNMNDPRAYSDLILKGQPDFVEVKGYMFLGSSRGRLSSESAPSHRDIRAFSRKLADLTGYYLLDEQIESRVVLLSQSKHIKRLQQT
jgi:tRNA wybutosine-synthesizing protein 1